MAYPMKPILAVPLDLKALENDDKSITHSFETKHLESMRYFLPIESHPLLYDNSEFDYLKFVGFEIIEGDIKNDMGLSTKIGLGRSQSARVGGGISESDSKKLTNSLKEKGFLLNKPPPAVLRDKGNITYITGQQRDKKLQLFNFTNRIVAVYERVEGCTDDQVANELSQLGNIFNPEPEACVPAKEHDIIAELVRAIDNGWVENSYDALYKRAKKQCAQVNIGDSKRSYLTLVALNTRSKYPVIPMNTEEAVNWLKNSKYQNIPGKVRYIVKSYDFWNKAVAECSKLANKHPNEEIRLIIHCGIVTGGLDQYVSRAQKFWSEWHTTLLNISLQFFDGKGQSPKNLVVYGIVGQVGEFMDTTQACLYVQDGDGEFYQKINDEVIIWGENP